MTLAETPNPLRVGLRRDRGAEPCTMVIFGAGDLTRRKLMPALANLRTDRLLPQAFAVVGVGRREMTDAEFGRLMRESTAKHSRRPLDENDWAGLAEGLSFVACPDENYAELRQRLERVDRERGTAGSLLFYLAVPPSSIAPIVRGLAAVGLHRPLRPQGSCRIVLEKPIGHDLRSARELNLAVAEAFDERDVFRIDHYLGKETVQNLLVFRFANAIFEPLWNHKYVDHVQLTVAESIGIGSRGRYYEEAGTTRDMVQNHMCQLLCLTAMEPPVSLAADAIRDEKVKVLQALRPLRPEEIVTSTVRAQYAEGVVDGERVPGYLAEADVSPTSLTETYVAMRVHIDNWRWAGVPFYLRAGKRMTKRVTEIALQFRDLPHRLFGQGTPPNTLALRIQPDEGVTLRFETKVPGPQPRIQPVSMEFRYGSSFGKQPPEAYERLIFDAMLGDSTLFIRRDEVEESWSYIDRLLEIWRDDRRALAQYAAGSWGPEGAEVLLRGDGRGWRRL